MSLLHQHGSGIEVTDNPQQIAPLIATHPLFQPDVVTVMMQNAVFEAQTAAAAALAGEQGIFQPGNIVGMHPIQPAEIIRPALSQSQQAQAGGITLQSMLG